MVSYKKNFVGKHTHILKLNSWKNTLDIWKPKVSRGGIYVKRKADFKLKIKKLRLKYQFLRKIQRFQMCICLITCWPKSKANTNVNEMRDTNKLIVGWVCYHTFPSGHIILTENPQWNIWIESCSKSRDHRFVHQTVSPCTFLLYVHQTISG